MRRLNGKLFLGSLGCVILLSGAVYSLHRLQSGRIAEALRHQSHKAEDNGRLDQAVKYLGRYLEFVPTDLDERARLGRILAGDLFAGNRKLREQAFFNLDQVLTLRPDHDDLRRLIVRVTLELRRFDKAKDHLDVLLQAHPEDGQVDGLQAQWYEAQGKTAEAVAWYRKAVTHAPQQIDNYGHLARLLRRRPDPSAKAEQEREADQVMDLLVARNESSVAAHLARWRYRKDLRGLDDAGRLQEAAADVTRALELAPDDAEALLAAATLAQAQGAPDRARTYLEKGFQLHPKDARMYQARARLEGMAGRRPEALQILRQGLQALPPLGQLPLRAELAEMLIDDGDAAEAGAMLLQLRQMSAPAALVDYLQGRVFFSQQRWADAAQSLERVRAATDPVAAVTRQVDQYLARCYEQLDQPARQLAAWGRVVQQDPSSVPARLKLAEALAAAGRLDDAVDQYRQILALPRAPAGGWAELARLLILRSLRREQPDWAEVREALDRADKALPGNVGVAVLRSQWLRVQGQLDQAEKLLTTIRDQVPKQVSVWVELASLAEQQGKADRARALLEEAGRQAGDSVALRLEWMSYWARHPGNDAKAALAKQEQELEAFTGDDRSRLLDGLAVACYRSGQVAKADALWSRLARQPGYENGVPIRRLLFELAQQRGDEAAMRQRVAEVARAEGGAGPVARLCQVNLLIWSAQNGNLAALDEARPIVDALAAQRPDWSVVAVARGEIEDLKGHPQQAIAQFRQALARGDRSPGVSLRLIQLLIRQQRYDEADKELHALRQQAPASADLQRLAAELSLRSQDPARAVEAARQAVLADAKDWRNVLALGQVLAATGQRPEEAERQFREAVTLAPEVPDTWLALVGYLAHTRQAAQAEAAILQARARLPAAEAPLTLARCYELVGKADEARAQYRQALAAKPDDLRLLESVVRFCQRTGRPAEAEPYLRRILDPRLQAPPSAAAWARRNLALALSGTGRYGQYQEALTLLGLSVASDGTVSAKPAGTDAEGLEEQRVQARVLSRQNHRPFRERALALLQRLPSLEPEDRLLLAQLYESDNAWPKARDQLRSLMAFHGQEPFFLRSYAQALLRHGQAADVEPLIDRLEELEKGQKVVPGTFGSVELRALVLEARGEASQGIALLKPFVTRTNARPEDVLILVSYLGRQKQLEEALDWCQRAWQTVPPEPVSVTLLGVLQAVHPAEKPYAARVEQWLKEAVQRHPQSPALTLQLAAFYDLQGNAAQAERLYQQVLEKDRENLVALNNLAWLFALTPGRSGKALELIQRAIDLRGPEPTFLDTRAVAYLSAGQSAPALADLKAVVADSPSATRYLHLAWAYHLAGHTDSAQAALRQAKSLGLNPDRLHPVERQTYQKMLDELVATR